jgi:MinD-like ATPase involved in chromosome partitioning or flagellar assembly
MSIPVLTALPGSRWEAGLVAALEGAPMGVVVVRRCIDLADLLVAAAAGTARAVLLSAELRSLDREALARLAAAGVAVVGLAAPEDETAEHRLRQLGVRQVLPADAGAEHVCAAVLEAVGTSGPRPTLAYSEPLAALPDLADPPPSGSELDGFTVPAPGRLVAVWGPAGAPGRTTVAINLAAELALLDVSTLVADADTYGGAVAQVLGLLDEAPGLAAAARLANTGSLDEAALARLSRQLRPRLRVLTGIVRPDRWVELRPAALETVWAVARRLVDVTVVDCGFCLEQDEELAFDTAAPRRNGATLATLALADVVLAVGSAEPVGVQRLVRGLSELRETVPGRTPSVVLNRVRPGPVGADPERQLRAALERYAGVSDPMLVPDDRAATDTALAAGRTLAEVAPQSPARVAIADVAGALVGRPVQIQARRWSRRQRRLTGQGAGR